MKGYKVINRFPKQEQKDPIKLLDFILSPDGSGFVSDHRVRIEDEENLDIIAPGGENVLNLVLENVNTIIGTQGEDIDFHTANTTIHFTEGSIDHTNIQNIGINSHAQIDSHISDATIHFTESSISHLNIQNIGTNSHIQIDDHISDSTIHFTEASISHLNIQDIGVNTHNEIDTHIANLTNPHNVQAVQVPFNNTVTGFTATDVQNAIDESYSDTATKLEYRLPLSTTLEYGGILSINSSDPTTFDITAGKGHVVDNYTDPQNPVITEVTWSDQTGITVTNIGTQAATFINIDVNGNIVQDFAGTDPDENRYLIEMGVLAHPAGTIIKVSNFNIWERDIPQLIADQQSVLGPRLILPYSAYIKASANANLNIQREDGRQFGMGVNYANDKQVPNLVDIPAIDPALLYRSYRTATGPSVFIPGYDVEVNYYDPNGDGTPVELPDGYWTAHKAYYSAELDILVVQDGQHAYDSQKKAVDSFAVDSYDNVPEMSGVFARTAIITQKGATDLTDPEQAAFVQTGVLGDRGIFQGEGYARFAENVELTDGLSYQRQSITFTENAGNVYLEIEDTGGGDMTYVFGQKEYYLDCTGGVGVNGKAQIQLTVGSDTNPVYQYVYITKDPAKGADAAYLNVSLNQPIGEYAYVWEGAIQSAATLVAENYSPYASQRNTEAKEHDGRGAIAHERERIRMQGSYTNANIGPTPLVTIVNNSPLPDDAYFDIGGGTAYQLHRHSVAPTTTASNGLRILNDPVSPWGKVYNINEILVDALGNTLNNRCFNLVFVGAINSADGITEDWLGVMLPGSTYNYNNVLDALADVDNTSVTNVPNQAQKIAYLLARVTFRYKNGVWENITENILGINYFDLRGSALGAQSGGIGTPIGQTFDDNNFQVQNASDTSKLWKVDVSGVTTTTTRTLTIPDENGRILVDGSTFPITLNTDLTASGIIDGVTDVRVNGNSVYHAANANLTTIDWNVKDLYLGEYNGKISQDPTGGFRFTNDIRINNPVKGFELYQTTTDDASRFTSTGEDWRLESTLDGWTNVTIDIIKNELANSIEIHRKLIIDSGTDAVLSFRNVDTSNTYWKMYQVKRDIAETDLYIDGHADSISSDLHLNPNGDVYINGNLVYHAGDNPGGSDHTMASHIDGGTYNNTNWDAAYAYSQIGHLPLSGGTVTGDVIFTGTYVQFQSILYSDGLTYFRRDGDEQLRIRPATGAYSPYISFYDSNTAPRTGYIQSANNNMYITGELGKTYINGITGAYLQYNSSDKLYTTSTGISVTGDISLTGTIYVDDIFQVYNTDWGVPIITNDWNAIDGDYLMLGTGGSTGQTSSRIKITDIKGTTVFKSLWVRDSASGDDMEGIEFSSTYGASQTSSRIDMWEEDTKNHGGGIGFDGTANELYLWVRNNTSIDDKAIRVKRETGNTTFSGNVVIGDTSAVHTLSLYGLADDTNLATRIEFRLNDGQHGQIRWNSFDSVRAPFGFHIEKTSDTGQGTSKAYLDVEGDIYAGGNIEAVGSITPYTSSDRRLKRNFRTIDNPIDKVKQLNGYYFNWTEEGMGLKGITKSHDVGLIAQDVQEVVPESVRTMWDTEYLGYDNTKITPLLVESIKALQCEIDTLKQQLEQYRKNN